MSTLHRWEEWLRDVDTDPDHDKDFYQPSTVEGRIPPPEERRRRSLARLPVAHVPSRREHLGRPDPARPVRSGLLPRATRAEPATPAVAIVVAYAMLLGLCACLVIMAVATLLGG